MVWSHGATFDASKSSQSGVSPSILEPDQSTPQEPNVDVLPEALTVLPDIACIFFANASDYKKKPSHQFLYINKWGLALSPMTIPFQQFLAGYCLCIFQDMPIKYQTCWYPDSAHVLYRTTSVDQQTQNLLLQLISPWLNINIVQACLYNAWIYLSSMLPIGQIHEQRSAGYFPLKQRSLWSTWRLSILGMPSPNLEVASGDTGHCTSAWNCWNNLQNEAGFAKYIIYPWSWARGNENIWNGNFSKNVSETSFLLKKNLCTWTDNCWTTPSLCKGKWHMPEPQVSLDHQTYSTWATKKPNWILSIEILVV